VAQGRRPASTMWEVYLTDPEEEPDPARWRTEVYWPVG
jgi:effector-binding domain-containing protein